MIVHYYPEQVPEVHGCVLTVGTFDGVHVGHRRLIEQVVLQARRRHTSAVLLTFDPHPRQVIRSEQRPIKLLTTTDEKIQLLKPLGIDHVVVVRFTEAFSQLSALAFVRDVLAKNFAPAAVVIGYNHQFGRHRDGNIELLRKLSVQFSFEVIEIERQLVGDVEASSTRIRLALQEGDVRYAAQLLGYPYFLTGTVVAGRQLGRQLGFPTANLQPSSADKLIPADGVYGVRVHIDEQPRCFAGLTAIGMRPTVQGRERTIETYLLDFNETEELYGVRLRIEFLHFLRPERAFPSLDELVAAMKADEQLARQLPDLFVTT
ncbi:MAG: bifunctional riboflavin kinase/FAD synthetase [Chitinophagales bacterium]|nr:bifunctional riboflavin kinase/FAD synthetase [Chitinophagales bacterium]MDW8427457.1 bifunctional riboflavin kinase/FAD synthetase [Chitinophagales bacterium]